MKKYLFVLSILTLLVSPSFASEITDDYFDIATNYCVQGNYRAASEYLDRILLIEPNNKTVLDLRNGLRVVMQGKRSSFIQSSAVNKAQDAKRIGNKDKEFTELAQGSDCWAYYFLGEYYKKDGKYQDAISAYVKSVNSKPTFTQCYLEIAICYYELGNYNQCLTYLNQYLKDNPRDDFAYFLKAKANLALNNNDNALNDVITAMAIENSVDCRFLEAKILYNMQKYSQTIEKLEQLKNDIQTAEYYKYLGLAYLELGNKVDAAINLEKSLLLCDDDATVKMKYNGLR